VIFDWSGGPVLFPLGSTSGSYFLPAKYGPVDTNDPALMIDWGKGSFVYLADGVQSWSGGFYLPNATNGLAGVAPLCLIEDWGTGPAQYLAEGIVSWTAASLVLAATFECDARASAAFSPTLQGSFRAQAVAGAGFTPARTLRTTVGLVVPASPSTLEWGPAPGLYLAGGAIATWTAPPVPPIVTASFESDARASAAFAPAGPIAAAFAANGKAGARFAGNHVAGTFVANARATAAFAGSLVGAGAIVYANFEADALAGATFAGFRKYTCTLECDGVATAIFSATLIGTSSGGPPNPLSIVPVPWNCEIGTGVYPVKWQAGRLIRNPANYAS
jgi:hypothetical protein